AVLPEILAGPSAATSVQAVNHRGRHATRFEDKPRHAGCERATFAGRSGDRRTVLAFALGRSRARRAVLAWALRRAQMGSWCPRDHRPIRSEPLIVRSRLRSFRLRRAP